MTLSLRDCPHCGTEGVLVMADGRCPHCKGMLAETKKDLPVSNESTSKEMVNASDEPTGTAVAAAPSEEPIAAGRNRPNEDATDRILEEDSECASEVTRYEKQDNRLQRKRRMGVRLLVASSIVAVPACGVIVCANWIPALAEVSDPILAWLCLGAIPVGLTLWYLFADTETFDNDSFLAHRAFCPTDVLNKDGQGVRVKLAFDENTRRVCVSRRLRPGKYEVTYYRADKVDLQIKIVYTPLEHTDRVPASGGEKAAAFILGGLPLAGAVTAFGRKRTTKVSRAIMEITVCLIPYKCPDAEVEIPVYRWANKLSVSPGQGRDAFSQAHSLQRAVAEAQASLDSEKPRSTSIEWIKKKR